MNTNISNEERRKSILEMARGGIMERVDYEMNNVVDNILDENTKATAKRKLTLTIEFTPDDKRQVINTQIVVTTSLAPSNPVVTALYMTSDHGKPCAVEMTPQTPGQIAMDGTEQAPPAILKVMGGR